MSDGRNDGDEDEAHKLHGSSIKNMNRTGMVSYTNPPLNPFTPCEYPNKIFIDTYITLLDMLNCDKEFFRLVTNRDYVGVREFLKGTHKQAIRFTTRTNKTY